MALGDLLMREMELDGFPAPREILVGDYVSDSDLSDSRMAIATALRRFDASLAEVRMRTGATLSVFPAYAPSETWYGLNKGKVRSGKSHKRRVHSHSHCSLLLSIDALLATFRCTR